MLQHSNFWIRPKADLQLNRQNQSNSRIFLSVYQETLIDVEKILVDRGYTGKPLAIDVKDRIGTNVEVAKHSELHTFKVIPKRWVVERSFTWLEKYRRVWKNCEHLLESSLGMVSLAFITLILRRY